MAEIIVPAHQPIPTPGSHSCQEEWPGQSYFQPRITAPALPATTLVFPRPMPETTPNDAFEAVPDISSNPPAKPVSYTHNRAKSAVHGLPAFNFNSSDSSGHVDRPETPPNESKPDSPITPTRRTRHRRTASEHIGGNATGAEVRPRSRSPLKTEILVLPSETAPPRGHRHRRSSALSSQDLSTVLRPTVCTEPQLDHGDQADKVDTNDLDLSPAGQQQTHLSPPSSNVVKDLQSPQRDLSKLATQPRVEFSDNLEFISRPLSTISSETESSMSTIRGHSIGDSISSYPSGGLASPAQTMSPRTLPGSVDDKSSPRRPKSAGAMTERSRRCLLEITQDFPRLHRPSSASAPSSPAIQTKRTGVGCYFDPDLSSSPSRKDSYRPRKVKSWASSLVNRRPKSPREEKIPAPTDDLGLLTSNKNHPEYVGPRIQFSENFDEDPTATILTDVPVFTSELATPPASASSTSTVNRIEPHASLIDVDAAEVPMYSLTTNINSHSWRNRPFSAARYSMHSSGSMGGFIGPGMHYHRRTESAPQMTPMQLERPEFRRLHSSSSTEFAYEMENVFEEDEDELNPQGAASGSTALKMTDNAGQTRAIALPVRNQSPTRRRWGQRPSSARPSLMERIQKLPFTPGQNEHAEPAFAPPQPDAVVVMGDDVLCKEGYLKRSSDSNVASLFPEQPKNLSDNDVQVNDPQQPAHILANQNSPPHLSPYAGGTLTQSISAPVLDLSTPPSSVDLRKPSIHGATECGSDFRPSVDDVPSLISSRSGVTSATHTHIPSVSSRNYGDYAASFKSSTSVLPQVEESRKRASIVSLSRLVGGTFGERSKLSHEQSASRPSTSPTKAKKEKRSRRLSRLLQFWRAKDAAHS